MFAASRRGRGAAVSGRRADLLARHVRRSGAELPRDSADGGRADRRDGGRAARDRRRGAAALARMDRASRRGRPRAVGGSGAVRAGADATGWRRRRGSPSRSTTRAAAAWWRLAARRCAGGDRRGRRRAVDPGRSAHAGRGARRRPPARHVSRRRAGRLGVRRLSRADRRCWSMPAACPPPPSFDIGDRVVAPVRARRRLPQARLPRADARRSRSHRRRRVDPARVPAAGGVGGHSGAALRAADAAARRGAGQRRRGGRTSIAAIALVIDGVDVVARHPVAGRLGAAEGAQRRLAGARAALARRVGAC